MSPGLAIGDEDKDSEVDEQQDHHEDEDQNLIGRRKKRKFKWETSAQKIFTLKFVISLIVIQSKEKKHYLLAKYCGFIQCAHYPTSPHPI